MILGVRVEPSPPPTREPRITLTRPPDPVPVTWTRSIANSLATELRRGWRQSRASRAIGNSRTGRDYRTANIPTPHPTVEVLWSQPYSWGIVDPLPALGVPMLAWHVLQLDAAEHLTHSHSDVDVFLRMRPDRGAQPLPYRLRPNRHGFTTLRRNSDYATDSVAGALFKAAEAATVWELDPGEAYDLLGEYDTIEASITLALLDSLTP